jgi:hypothetical protein
MRPEANDLLYGDAHDVADLLQNEHPILHEDLIPALINALRRIDLLELKVQNLTDTLARTESTLDRLAFQYSEVSDALHRAENNLDILFQTS